MKKYLFILLLTIAGYGQTYQNPTYGTIKTKTAPTVTSTSYLGAISATGVVGKIVPTSDILTNESTVTGLTTTEALNNLNTALGTNNIATAYVETNGNDATAQIGNSRKAYLTIDAALDALPAGGGVIKIGVGSFASPTVSKVKSNTAFIGSGKPYPDMTIAYTSDTAKPTISSPTKLVGGTILKGAFYIIKNSNTELRNLGIDVGKDYIDTFKGGVAENGLVVTGNSIPELANTVDDPLKGVLLSNISSLNYTYNSATHAILIQNVAGVQISNISTYYGEHGLVIKGTNVNVNGLEAYGHGSNGLIVKANTYSYCSDVNVSNVYISSIVDNDGGGINIVSESGGTLRRVNLSNITVEFTIYGIKDEGGVDGLNISNANFNNIYGHGVLFSASAKDVSLDNVHVNGSTIGHGFLITSNSLDNIKNLSNCTVKNIAAGLGFSLVATSGLINVVNSNAYNEDITITGNVRGYNFNTNAVFTGNLSYDTIVSPTSLLASGTNGKVSTVPASIYLNARPYKVYVALITQTGTSAPTATVLENTLGGTVVWTRSSVGTYVATLNGAFILNKTCGFFNSNNGGNPYVSYVNISSLNSVSIQTVNSTNGTSFEAGLANASVEIRVYN